MTPTIPSEPQKEEGIGTAHTHEEGPWCATDSGVRNRAGYIAHMRLPPHWPGQDERYVRECNERVMSKHLIAAAPELLAALKMLADWSDKNVADPALTGPLGYARAAIAKATGSTQ